MRYGYDEFSSHLIWISELDLINNQGKGEGIDNVDLILRFFTCHHKTNPQKIITAPVGTT